MFKGYDAPTPPIPSDLPEGAHTVTVSRSERMVLDALRRIRRSTPFRPCVLVLNVESDGVTIRACGQPERVRDGIGMGY